MCMKIFALLLLVAGSLHCYGQDTVYVKPADNSVYLEAFGQSLYYSLNYDRILADKGRERIGFSAGISVLPISYMEVYAGSASANYLLGRKNHLLELGIGLSGMRFIEKEINIGYSYIDGDGNAIYYSGIGRAEHFFLYLTPKIGYRFQKRTGGFMARVTLTPPVGLFSKWGETYDLTNGQTIGGSYVLILKEAAFFPYVIFPWAGISFGYSF
jgi:hypothetical protein